MAGRRLPPRQHLVADPPRRGRASCAWSTPQGAPPTVPFWLGEAPARTPELSAEVSALRARGRRAPRPRTTRRRAGVARERVRARRPRRDARSSATSRAGAAALGVAADRSATSSSSASSTRRAACSSSSTRRSAAGSTARSASRCASASAVASTSSCRRRPATTPSCSRSGRSTASRSRTCRSFLRPENARGGARAGAARSRRCSRRAGAGTSAARSSVLRQRGGRRNPPPIQRMEADDLMAAVFPALAALPGERGAGPDRDPGPPAGAPDDGRLPARGDGRRTGSCGCSTAIEAGEVRPHFRDTTEPSPLAHEILNGRPYTFLDDAPLEERRTRAVALRRGLPETARDLGRARPGRDRARARARRGPTPRDADELHDAAARRWSCCGREAEWSALVRRAGRRGRAAQVPARRRARSGWRRSGGRAWTRCSRARRSSPTCAAASRDRRARRSTRRRRGRRDRAATSRASGPCTAADLAARDRALARGAVEPARSPGSRPRASRCAATSIRRATRPSRSSARGASSPASTATRRTACGARSSR